MRRKVGWMVWVGCLVLWSEGCNGGDEKDISSVDTNSGAVPVVTEDTAVVFDTDNPYFSEFHASVCGAELPDSTGIHEKAMALSTDFSSMACVSWKTDTGGNVTIGITNQSLPCGGIVTGTVRPLEENSVVLSVFSFSAYCSCCYSISWTLRADAIDTASTLSVCLNLDIGDQYWSGRAEDEINIDAYLYASPVACDAPIILPINDQPNGTLCSIDGPCDPNGPLHKWCDDQSQCDDGYICTLIDETDERQAQYCLAECSEDSACPNEKLSCQDGICRAVDDLAINWVVVEEETRQDADAGAE